MWEIAAILFVMWIICGWLAFGYSYGHCCTILHPTSKTPVLRAWIIEQSWSWAFGGPVSLIRMRRDGWTKVRRLYPRQSTRFNR